MAELDRFLTFLSKQGGSDLHLVSDRRPMIRLHGTMVALNMDPLEAGAVERLLLEVMPHRNTQEYQTTRDTDFAYEIPGLARFRCNVFSDRHGPGGVFRIIPSRVLTAEELGLPESVKAFCQLPKGLVLVTGATGSGKSTTLAAMIDLINRTRKDHIITIEDPIEFVHENKSCMVNQREVKCHTESFARALRAALREDPDIVLVGEMRDLETTHIAIETAETGHLVLGTLHTTTAASTVDRLIDQFPTAQQEQIRTMLSTSLKGVVAQTLLRRKDGKGRAAAFEVLIANAAVQNNIREGKTYQIPSILQLSAKHGMVCLNDSILRLVMEDKVAPAEALARAVDREDLRQRLTVAGFTI
ncbi:MAG: type IV pilus twitching motility protein PilT [Planctomycetes bacterium]|jgi:twitching motility protein PilT|nr:type IV pilus twitching motility protein PilT [Planctomycetota bacterium]